MSSLNRWEIWEADVPYIDKPGKSSIRPVLIISPDIVLSLKITTHGHSDKPRPFEYEISKWREAGLTAQSYIQCDKYVRLTKERFTGRYFGRLKMTDIVLLKQLMHFHNLILPDD